MLSQILTWFSPAVLPRYELTLRADPKPQGWHGKRDSESIEICANKPTHRWLEWSFSLNEGFKHTQHRNALTKAEGDRAERQPGLYKGSRRWELHQSQDANTFHAPSCQLWRRQWHPIPVLLPGKSHGWRSLVGCSPWGREESDTTERLHFHFSLSCIGEGNGSPLQCSCLENPRDRGACWAAVYGVAQSRTQLKWLSSSSCVYMSVSISEVNSLSSLSPLVTMFVHHIWESISALQTSSSLSIF